MKTLAVYARGESPLTGASPLGHVQVNTIPLGGLVWKKDGRHWHWAVYRVTPKPDTFFYYEEIS